MGDHCVGRIRSRQGLAVGVGRCSRNQARNCSAASCRSRDPAETSARSARRRSRSASRNDACSGLADAPSLPPRLRKRSPRASRSSEAMPASRFRNFSIKARRSPAGSEDTRSRRAVRRSRADSVLAGRALPVPPAPPRPEFARPFTSCALAPSEAAASRKVVHVMRQAWDMGHSSIRQDFSEAGRFLPPCGETTRLGGALTVNPTPWRGRPWPNTECPRNNLSG